MIKRHTKNFIAAIATAILLTACTTTGSQISAEDRDTTGRYDGVWLVSVAKGATTQHIQSWVFDCGDMTTEFQITVQDGTMNLSSNSANTTAYVSKEGKFKVFLPIVTSASSSSQSDVTLDNAKQKIVLSGNLNSAKAKGRITYGIAEFGWAGCTSTTKYSPIKPSV